MKNYNLPVRRTNQREARAPAAQAPPGPLRGRHPRRATAQGATTYHPQPNRC